MLNFKLFVFLPLIVICLSCNSFHPVKTQGEFKKWHTITFLFNGPETSEKDENNPFLYYRLDVTFSQGDKKYSIPGYYAADGNAAETSAGKGNKWAVKFSPCSIGNWKYRVSFKTGKNIAVADNIDEFNAVAYLDGYEGEFFIKENNKTDNVNWLKGRLEYVGEWYLKFKETGEYFIKLGVDAPENLLAYQDFDETPDVFHLRKTWSFHKKDFRTDAVPYLWQNNKGKNLLGAISYLASNDLNAFSFLTFNIDGDDRNVFPHLLKEPMNQYEQYANEKSNSEAWKTFFHTTRFDVSKLDQWERILAYGEKKGMFLHFKTHETETDHIMDNGVFGIEGKLYYRELIARFGHHLSMCWNLGEENNQPIDEVIKVAKYVHNLDAYKHHIVVHTFPDKDGRYQYLIGMQSPLTGASLQLRDSAFRDVHQRVLKWRSKSDSTGRKWALSVDEPGNAKYALLPDSEDKDHYLARKNALYGALMASAFGVEWYFGYKSPHSDLTCQDFRTRELFWEQNRFAKDFFLNYIPFSNMKPTDSILSDTSSYCLASKNLVYTIYIPAGTSTKINLGNTGFKYSVHWYNPRKGGDLFVGSVPEIIAGKESEFGQPPADIQKDWLVLLKRETP